MQDERKRILKMVEDGKLSVDEALTLLDGLQNAGQTMEEKQEELVQELSTTFQFEEAKKEDPFQGQAQGQGKFQSAKEKLFDFVDSALKKIKDIDFDFNFGQSIDVSHIFHHSDVYIKDMDIDVANGSIRLAAWDQPDVRIECQAKVYRVENQDEARQNFLKDVIFAIEGGKLRFNSQQKWMKVDALIYVPRTQYERIRVRMFNGPITGEDLEVTDFRVKTANGKINVDRLHGKTAEVETANGPIKMVNSVLDELEAETLNGAIKLDGDFKKVEMETFSGHITCSLRGDRGELVIAKATTGGVDVFVPEGCAVNGELKTNLGGFNMKLEGVQILEDKSEMVQKVLRFESVHSSDKMLKVFGETKTGTITLQKADPETGEK